MYLHYERENAKTHFRFYSVIIIIVDEKSMIRSGYNRIPHPSLDTIRERNTNKSRRHKEITAQSESQEVSSSPVDVHEAILNIMNK